MSSSHPKHFCPRCQHPLPNKSVEAGMTVACSICGFSSVLPDVGAGKSPTFAAQVPTRRVEPEDGLAIDFTEIFQGAEKLPLATPPSAELSEEPLSKPAEPENGARQPKVGPAWKVSDSKALASMMGIQSWDEERLRTKGRLAFSCPLCSTLLEVPAKDAGKVLKCSGCHQEVLAPEPATGSPAQIVDGSTQLPRLPKAVLPSARKVVDQSLAEAKRAVRAKRDLATDPESDRTGRGIREPIQPRPDPVMAPTALPERLPASNLTPATGAGFRQKTAPQEILTQSIDPLQTPSSPPSKPGSQEKGILRLNDQRRDFTPLKIVEHDVESSTDWGNAAVTKPTSKKFSILLWSALVLALLAISLVVVFKVVNQGADKPAGSIAVRTETDDTLENVSRAKDILKSFFSSDQTDARAKFVRHPEITLPRMKKFYGDSCVKREIQSMDDPRVSRLDGVELLTLQATIDDLGLRLITFEVIDKGDAPSELRIDWESMEAWSEISFDEFLAKQVLAPTEMRVEIVLADFPSPQFSADSWVCFKITKPNAYGKGYGYCFGYCQHLDPAMTRISAELRRTPGTPIPCRLTIAFVPSTQSDKYAPRVIIKDFKYSWLELHPGE